jgi:hypothetical protein
MSRSEIFQDCCVCSGNTVDVCYLVASRPLSSMPDWQPTRFLSLVAL